MRFNGVELRAVHPRISINKEFPPGMPAHDVILTGGTRGYGVYGTRIKDDEYTVRVNIACRTREEGWAVLRKVAAWAGSSGEETAELIPTMLPNKAYDAIVKSIESPEFKFGFATFDVVFLLPRPILHDTYDTSAEAGNGSAAMRIGGTSDCRPVIRQTLAGANTDGLTYALDGRTTIKLNGSFAAGDVIVIDYAAGAITRNGANILARLVYTDANWQPGFTPGRHTMTSTDAGRMEATWRNEWK